MVSAVLSWWLLTAAPGTVPLLGLSGPSSGSAAQRWHGYWAWGLIAFPAVQGSAAFNLLVYSVSEFTCMAEVTKVAREQSSSIFSVLSFAAFVVAISHSFWLCCYNYFSLESCFFSSIWADSVYFCLLWLLTVLPTVAPETVPLLRLSKPSTSTEAAIFRGHPGGVCNIDYVLRIPLGACMSSSISVSLLGGAIAWPTGSQGASLLQLFCLSYLSYSVWPKLYHPWHSESCCTRVLFATNCCPPRRPIPSVLSTP